MKKKIVSLLLSAAMAASLAACGNSGSAKVETVAPTQAATTAAAEEAKAEETKAEEAKEEAEETKGFGAYLGIAGVDLDSNTAYQYNMPTGVYVASVVEGSGSQAAGIEKGDVITAFQGKDILSMTELQEQIAKCHPGDTVKVSVAKANANFAITTYDVTLTEVIGD